MLTFKDGNIIRGYKIQLEDEKKAREVMEEIISKRKIDTHSTTIRAHTGSEFSDFHAGDCYDLGRIVSERYEDYYPDIKCVKTTMKFSAPYTLAFASELLLPESEYFQKYCTWLKEQRFGESLYRVIGDESIDDLSAMISCFKNDPEIMKKFLSRFYQDLFYFRQYLECIRLNQIGEYPIMDIEQGKVDVASSNTETAQKLCLTFKGRDF